MCEAIGYRMCLKKEREELSTSFLSILLACSPCLALVLAVLPLLAADNAAVESVADSPLWQGWARTGFPRQARQPCPRI